jgi:dTDP-4-dehydrorhamnose 3,5-epimerase
VSDIDFIEIEGVQLVNAFSTSDSRGSFVKFFPGNLLFEKLDSVAISTNPKMGTIRGIHFQIEPFAEEKIISCIQGSTFEVIVDLRPNSKTVGKIATFELSKENAKQVYLPKGIAHGFQTLAPMPCVWRPLCMRPDASGVLLARSTCRRPAKRLKFHAKR